VPDTEEQIKIQMKW